MMTASRTSNMKGQRLKIQLLLFIVHCTLYIVHCPLFISKASAQPLTFVELNCENLFDCSHDEGKQDHEFMPDGSRHWTRTKYWRKLNSLGQTILSCADELPDLVALVEVENDTALFDLTRRSLLRNADYQYLMTSSPDVRGLDVALLYRAARFAPLCYDHIEVPVLKHMRPTRDILYIKGETVSGDTLHVFVIHAPSRTGGEKLTKPFRMQVVRCLEPHLQTIGKGKIIIAGDFNDYDTDASLKALEALGLTNITKKARGRYGVARATYRHQGHWRSLDHILLSPSLAQAVYSVYINDAPFLLEDETKYGGKKPFRTFNGFRYNGGVSDHLPLVVKIKHLKDERRENEFLDERTNF